MLRTVLVALVALALTALAPADALAARCAPRPHYRDIAAGRAAVVSVTVKGPVVSNVATYRICRRATGRSDVLAKAVTGDSFGESIGPFAFAGRWVVFASSHDSKYDDGTTGLQVFDTVARRATDLGVAVTTPAGDFNTGGIIRELATDTRLRVAYISQGRLDSAGVYGVAPGRVPRLLDGARRDELRGLSLTGGIARWSHAGEPRKAPVASPA